MGQCLCRKEEGDVNIIKQDENIDECLKSASMFCFQIGYNRRAVKTYGSSKAHDQVVQGPQNDDPTNGNEVS